MEKKVVKKWCFTPSEIVEALRRTHPEIPQNAMCDLLDHVTDDETFVEFELVEDDEERQA